MDQLAEKDAHAASCCECGESVTKPRCRPTISPPSSPGVPTMPGAVLRVGGLSGTALQVFLMTYVSYAVLYFGRKPLSVTKGAMGLPTSTLGNMDTAFLAVRNKHH